MRKRLRLILASLLLVAVGGIALGSVTRKTDRRPHDGAVVTSPLRVARVTAPAAVELIDPVEVGVPATGRIDKLLVRDGMRVRAGALLATIVDEAKYPALQRADAEMRRARDRGASAGVDRAQTRAVALRKHTTEIRATASGTVIASDLVAGGTVRIGTRALTIARNVAGKRLVAQVRTDDVVTIQSGAAITFTVPAYPERSFDGTLVAIREGLTDGTSMAVVETNDPGHALRAGMLGTVMFAVVLR